MNLWILILWLYAGFAFAEVATIFGGKNSTAAKVTVYALLLVAWPILMPWVPKFMHTRDSRKQGGRQ